MTITIPLDDYFDCEWSENKPNTQNVKVRTKALEQANGVLPKKGEMAKFRFEYDNLIWNGEIYKQTKNYTYIYFY